MQKYLSLPELQLLPAFKAKLISVNETLCGFSKMVFSFSTEESILYLNLVMLFNKVGQLNHIQVSSGLEDTISLSHISKLLKLEGIQSPELHFLKEASLLGRSKELDEYIINLTSEIKAKAIKKARAEALFIENSEENVHHENGKEETKPESVPIQTGFSMNFNQITSHHDDHQAFDSFENIGNEGLTEKFKTSNPFGGSNLHKFSGDHEGNDVRKSHLIDKDIKFDSKQKDQDLIKSKVIERSSKIRKQNLLETSSEEDQKPQVKKNKPRKQSSGSEEGNLGKRHNLIGSPLASANFSDLEQAPEFSF